MPTSYNFSCKSVNDYAGTRDEVNINFESSSYREIFEYFTVFAKAMGCSADMIVDYYEEQVEIITDEIKRCAERHKEMTEQKKFEEEWMRKEILEELTKKDDGKPC